MNCKNTGLCLFDEQDVQVDIRGKVITDYHPINTISPGAPIEFQILGVPDDYIDLGDIRMLLRVKIKKTDGKPWDSATDKVNFINLPLSSVFQDVFVQLGDTQIEGGQHLYPYNAYLSSLLQFHPSAKETHMEAWGWIEDTPGKFDSDADNDGIKMRRQETDKGATWEVMGPLFLDMTRQPLYLLPQTNVRLKFLPAKAEFCLQDTGGKKVYDYEIEKCVLYVPRITVMDSVISGHNKGLEKANVKYNLNHIDIGTFTITKENRSFIKDGLFTSQVPKMIVIGFLEHDAFN